MMVMVLMKVGVGIYLAKFNIESGKNFGNFLRKKLREASKKVTVCAIFSFNGGGGSIERLTLMRSEKSDRKGQ